MDQMREAGGGHIVIMWQPIATVPYDCDIQLAVIERGDVHALVFPCRRIRDGWIDARTKQRVMLRPTHWRAWEESDGRTDGNS